MKLLTCMYEGQEIPAVLSLDRQSVLPLHELGYPVRNMNQLIQSTSPEDLRIIAARARTALEATLWFCSGGTQLRR